MNPQRKLKIHSKYRALKYGHTIVPQIKLEGHWLQALGFVQGKEIRIFAEPCKLTIEVEKL